MQTLADTLAGRLGIPVHRSPLRRRLSGLMKGHNPADAVCLEDWLVDVANARGATVVVRDRKGDAELPSPSVDELSNDELVVGICQPHCLDRPQMLRLAGQLISRGAVDMDRLVHLARTERAGVVLGEMARQALKLEAEHELWRRLADVFPPQPLRSPIIHWNRLAWPRPRHRAPNVDGWELVR